jgi:hypothetical protein
MRIKKSIIAALVSGVVISSVSFAGSAGEPGRSEDGPNPLKNVYFGEQHLHTQDSCDAFAMGTRNTQDDAYNYAKGLAVKKVCGDVEYTVQRRTPYDWCATTDHSEMLGLVAGTLDPQNPLSKTEVGKLINAGKMQEAFGILIHSVQDEGRAPAGFDGFEAQKTAWDRQKATTNKHYEPGKFTTLIAYEWTSFPNGANMHRNVFFRDDKGPDMPFSSLDSDIPEDLWTYLEYQRKLGHETFAIPHNGNVSNSQMFAPSDSEGIPITRARAERRALNEVATEIVQTKGSSDTHPALSPNDEFANFEIWPWLLGTGGAVGKKDYSYVRQALINGVGYQEILGVNPFKLGIVAGADSHTAFSVSEEGNYTGVHGNVDNTAKLRLSGVAEVSGAAAIYHGSPGVTAVWAKENTREEIFDGIAGKETYGTSGTMIRLRFFGGWDYSKKLVNDKNFVKKAYKDGVPMGGDLPKMSSKAPTFAVWASKDPDSGNLDRIQIIKGWFQKGLPWEKVYDVAWSDGRVPDAATGKVPAVGNTVNIAKATYDNSIGDSELKAVWTDPDFDPTTNAVYYVRVLEIPTPRWTTYDAASLGVAVPDGVAASIQERAWSSPIWYTRDPSLEKEKKHQFFPGLMPGINFD